MTSDPKPAKITKFIAQKLEAIGFSFLGAAYCLFLLTQRETLDEHTLKIWQGWAMGGFAATFFLGGLVNRLAKRKERRP